MFSSIRGKDGEKKTQGDEMEIQSERRGKMKTKLGRRCRRWIKSDEGESSIKHAGQEIDD